MGIEYKVVKTGEGQSFNVDIVRDLSCSHSQVVPDLTGDGVPDYLAVAAGDTWKDIQNCKKHQHYKMMRMFVIAGGLEKGQLVPKDAKEVFKTEPPAEETFSQAEPITPLNYVPLMIREPEVKDFNGDGLMDISFYLYVSVAAQYDVGRFDGYEKVLLLAEKKPEQRAAK